MEYDLEHIYPPDFSPVVLHQIFYHLGLEDAMILELQ